MAGTPHERTLAAEMLLCMGAQTADALSDAHVGTFALPDPSRYFATVIVFTMLSGAAMFGERAGRLAATFGGVATLAILLAPTKASVKAGTPEPLAMRVIGYFAQIMGGGVQGVNPPVGGTPVGVGSAPGQVPSITQTGPNSAVSGGSAGVGITQTPPGQIIH